MGNYVSNNAVYLTAKRFLMRYNIESRTFKEIERQSQKPIVAPKHEGGIIDYHKSLKENTDYLAKTTVVNKDLDDRLKDVYVTSQGLTENIKSDKSLPMNRSTDTFALGYKDVDRVPPGKVSLLQAINFISKHQTNPEEWTIEKIAEENKIKPDVASDIVKYFRVFDVHLAKNLDRNEMDQIKNNLKLLGAKSDS